MSYVLTLMWVCQKCGWELAVNAPGFAGDGKYHYPDGRTPCGPIHAHRILPEGLASPGSVVLTAEQVEQVREDARQFLARFTDPAFTRSPMHATAVGLCHRLLALLDKAASDA